MFKHSLKIAAAAALSAALCMNAALPVAAAETKTAAITKILQMGEGVTTPAVTFTFEFTPSDEDNAANFSVPAIADKTAVFAADTAAVTEDGIKSAIVETPSIFDGVEWPHAGLFTYYVTEKQSVIGTLTEQETVTYSQAKYKVTAFVANGADGLYVAWVAAEVTVTDGEEGTDADGKIDATPGGDPSVSGDYSKMAFTNKYVKNTGTGDPADYTLAISKTVDTAEKIEYDVANREMYFDFLVTVTKSGANPDNAQKYAVFIMDGGGNVVTAKENFAGTILTDDKFGAFFEITQGEAATISLKHGQWMSFTNLEVGASYTVTETARENFTPAFSRVINGGTPAKETGSANTALTVPKTAITEGDDRADFTNTFAVMTPVGVSLDDLPFIMLIGLEAAILIGFIAYKLSRRKEDKDAEGGLIQ